MKSQAKLKPSVKNMAKGQLIKTFAPSGYAYVPANDVMQRLLDRQSIGDMIEASFNIIRCPAKHRRFFAMIGEAYKFASTTQTIINFRKALTFEAGFHELFVDLHGEAKAIPKSLEYAKMDEDEFAEVHSRVLDVIIQTLGFDEETQTRFILNWSVPVK